MKRTMSILVAALAAVSVEAGPAWEAMQRGLGSYAGGDFAAAATNFDAAATQAPGEKFDPAAAAFNRANALMKTGRMKDAAQAFEQGLRTTDLGLQSSAYHNRGNALLGVAGEQEKEQKLEDAIKSVDEAMTMYERSMLLAPGDRDPKINYELAGLKKQELEEKLKEQQQQQQQQNDQKQDQDQDKKKDKDKDKQKQDQKDQEQDQQQQQQQQNQQQDEEERDQGEQDQKRTEQMTPQEAAMLLDAMKQREQAQRERIGQIWLKRSNTGKLDAVDKDW